MEKLSLNDLDLKGKRVLMRVDFNVPLDKSQKITDDTRIRAAIPSIRYVVQHGGKLILMSHLGRPKGKDPILTLKPCAERLSELLGKPVEFVSDSIGAEVESKVENLKDGEVLLLENLRFYPGEEKPEQHSDFARDLARLGDIYVNDAFGTAHRDHTSTCTIAKYFVNKAAAGFLMQKEIKFLGQIFKDPEHPFLAIIGGAKISSKIGVLKSLLKKVDALLIAGAMSFTFLKVQGVPIGNSLFEEDQIKIAEEILNEAHQRNIPLYFPKDHIVTDNIENPKEILTVDNQKGIPEGMMGVDIGPKTIEEYIHLLSQAKTVFWNGPLGVFEEEKFAFGTHAIAKAVANLSATTIVGGGDSIAALQSLKVIDKITHASTGGGASLEYIEFGHLPGIEILTDR